MQKQVFEGKIEYMQILDETGQVDMSLFPTSLNDEKIILMYKYMSLSRALDAKALSLQRQGRLATYAPLLGQEATQVGTALAMRQDDFFIPNFRQHGVFVAREASLKNFFLAWKGFEEGNKIEGKATSLAPSVPVGTQIPHAVGVALAQKYKKTGLAAVAFIGDGGTSEGDFYEGMNFAGIMKVPLVIIIENNEWAISVPRKMQTAAETLAQKALAAGIRGMQVDGNDVIAVYKAVEDALAGISNGPVVIECLTYRMGMHTTSDDPSKYRPDAEVEAWKPRDPILRLKKYLNAKGLWDDAKEKAMSDEHTQKIEQALEEAEKFKPNPKDMLTNIYSFTPEGLEAEMKEAEDMNFWQ